MISKVYIMKKGISVVIFAHNDQDRLETCIKSINSLTTNIFLLDIASTDKTSIIAEQLGAKVYKTKFVQYVELVREEGVKLADTQWVLILDADESLTHELVKEIKVIITGPVKSFPPVSARHGCHDLRAVRSPSTLATQHDY